MNEVLITPAEFYEYYRYPSSVQIINASNALLAAYDHYVWTMAQARMRPASIVDWTHSIIAMWEKPTHG